MRAKTLKQTDPPFELNEVQLLAEQVPQRMASASVRIGDVIVHGLTVWRSRNGHLSILWPSYKPVPNVTFWQDVLELDPLLREEIEATIIAAYKDAKKQASKPKQNEALSDEGESTPRILYAR